MFNPFDHIGNKMRRNNLAVAYRPLPTIEEEKRLGSVMAWYYDRKGIVPSVEEQSIAKRIEVSEIIAFHVLALFYSFVIFVITMLVF